MNKEMTTSTFDALTINFEENYYAHVENTSIEFLDSILKEDISFYYDDEKYIDFLYFLCL